MHRLRQWLAGAAAWGMAAIVAAGCTVSSGSPGPGPSRGVLPAYGTYDINAQPVRKLREGGSLVLPVAQMVTQFNFHHADAAVDDVWTIDTMTEPRLFLRDAAGEPHRVPEYLTSATVTSTSPQVVTYRLNPRARWSDGKALSWRDFAAQWRALGRGDQRYLVADPTGYDRIEEVGPGAGTHEVRVTFREPFTDWRELFTPLFPAAAYSTPEQFDSAWREALPVTAGPFKLGSVDRTAQTVTLVPDAKWWGSRPRLDRIVFRSLDPDAALQAYLNGEVDAVNAATTEAYQRLRTARDSDIRIGSAWDEVHITLNGAGGPLADRAVRNALQQAVNRPALADVAAEGLPVKVPLLDNHFFMTNQPGYADNSGRYGTYDPEAAARTLQRAGWKTAGEGKPRVKDGRELRLRFVLSEGTNRLGLDLAELIQQMLGQVGVHVDIQKVPPEDYGPHYLNEGNFDLAIFRFTGQTYPSSAYPVYRQPVGQQVFENYGRVSDPEVDRLLGQAVGTLDTQAARSLYNRADAEVWRLGHDIELYQRPQLLAVRKGLANYGVPGLGDVDFTKVGWMK
ncbi:ABC transporter family substrate-binding protein [Streptomyces sp. NBC_01136]|uniref:ABC transporter family substrate-binding protein n=1 Tax=Streptomyces sp. NBC_01136 TaxID=2903754 RepID=UPI00386E4D8A|nr:ABC transporter family substrate-binding protein [Streptomyces sp. NBC_01136]